MHEVGIVWAQVATYLTKRLQATPGEKAGRKPDMSAPAAAAMRAASSRQRSPSKKSPPSPRRSRKRSGASVATACIVASAAGVRHTPPASKLGSVETTTPLRFNASTNFGNALWRPAQT